MQLLSIRGAIQFVQHYTSLVDISKICIFKKMFMLAWPIWLPVFSLFSNEPELGTEIDPGMAITTFPSSLLDKTRFEPTTYRA